MRSALISIALSAVAATRARPAAPQSAVISSGLLTIGVAQDASSGSVYISNFGFFAAGNATINLAATGGDAWSALGGTSLGVVGSAPVAATCASGCSITAQGNSSISVTGVSHGGVGDSESWVLSFVDPRTLQWAVTRTYSAPVQLFTNRQSITVVTTGSPPIHGNQIPSYLDPDATRFNESAAAGYALGDGFFEFTARPTQWLQWAPTGAAMTFQHTYTASSSVTSTSSTDAGAAVLSSFSFAKPQADGTAQHASIGGQVVNRSTGVPVPVPAGCVETLTMTLSLVPEGTSDSWRGVPNPFPALNFSLPSDPQFTALVQQLAAVQNQYNGFIFGNNPASVPCLHEMGWFPLIQGLFPAGSAGIAAVARQVEYIATCGFDHGAPLGGPGSAPANCTLSDRGLMQRWASSGFYNCIWGPLQDQNPHFLIAVHAVLTATGDKAWATRLLPAVRAVATYLETGINASTNGVFRCPASGLADGGHHTSNWLDIVEFGASDGYTGTLVVWALECVADLFAWLGDGASASHYARLHAAAQASFRGAMWNSSASAFADWIDDAGDARFYFYTDVQFKAIFLGIATPSQAAAVLSRYEQLYGGLLSQFNVTAAQLWSPPSNMIPVTNPLEFAKGATTPIPYPAYENGGSFFHTVGYGAQAYAAAGNASAGFELFRSFLLNGYTINRAWAQQLYWNTGSLVGFDPLNNVLLTLWGLLHGVMGIRPTLSQGLQLAPAAAPQLEGASFTFSYMGANACVTVQGGVPVLCS